MEPFIDELFGRAIDENGVLGDVLIEDDKEGTEAALPIEPSAGGTGEPQPTK